MYIENLEEDLFSRESNRIDLAKKRIGLIFSAIEFGEIDRLAALWEQGEILLKSYPHDELRDYLTMLLLASLIAKSEDASLIEHLAQSDTTMTRHALEKVARINDNLELMRQLNTMSIFSSSMGRD